MEEEYIVIKGAREHNLKNLSLKLPRNKLITITGVSGSGKSSLAFDTLYAEGRRRYVESLSSYARQFLGEMDKPDVDYIEGLSPAISIDQKGPSHNPRSTVGTVTEIYDYLRLLYARIGKPHCPKCGRPIQPQTVQQMTDQLMKFPEGTKLMVMAPLIRGRKGEYHKLLGEIRQKGYSRVRVDGSLYELNEEIPLDKNIKHTIEAVVDRLIVKPEAQKRLTESLETALGLSGEGQVTVYLSERDEELIFSENFSCPVCGLSIAEIAPRLFSFNSPFGACPECSGMGVKLEVDQQLIIPDESLSLSEGAVIPFGKPVRDFRHRAWESWFWGKLGDELGRELNWNTPYKDLSKKIKEAVLYGRGDFEGVLPFMERRFLSTESEMVREEIQKYMRNLPCPACGGARLKPEALAVKLGKYNLAQLCALSIAEAMEFFAGLKLTQKEEAIARQIFKEVRARLSFLLEVGLEYLTLDRRASTLAGGEAQRIRLATQIGSGLVGVLYILDEPTIGLHQRDNLRLIKTLISLKNLGNTVVVVEHDREVIEASDYIVDIGPGAGVKGGEVVAAGTLEEIMAAPESLTGKYFSGELGVEVPKNRRKAGDKFLLIKKAAENNLKKIDVKIPLGLLVVITGVSGSGKSTLLEEILYKSLAAHFYKSRELPGKHQGVEGLEHIDKVIIIDQSPIGRTPRSNPATYTGVFDPIRQLYALTVEAKKRGYKPGRFSFNVKGGRCEACQGAGILKIEMHFLPDVYVPCEECKGKRYNRETLGVFYRGKNIYEILAMTVDEGVEFFAHHPKIIGKLKVLQEVGLGYIKLGQPATTLSGGEAQRVKLSEELSRRSTGRTLYLLDEPTTGLHFDDVRKLLGVIQRLVDAGNTVLVIEHNPDIIKSADYLIDLGPEGGEKGGYLVASGSPEEVAKCKGSYTGEFLRGLL